MPDTIRIKASQSMVNYRTPTSFLIRESYPLPPYSTVVGMIHSVCGFDSWRPMAASVQGTTRGITSDLFVRYAFGNQKFDATRHQLAVPMDAEKSVHFGVSRGIAHTELLVDVELVLHIRPEREEDFDAILAGLNSPRVYPSLGRYEDLLDIHEVKVVSTEEKESVFLKHMIYVPGKLLEGSENSPKGTVYRLHKEYEYDAKKRRRWKDTIDTHLFASGDELFDFEADEDDYPVAFA